ncbi:motility associated factor glycosyltransferase family protein [Butyrivibrio sp. VCD2006]|uniref:motility associated factor glycosyltransferase family protein n=1 Tax=Butyrivibrio sp. VCD2006 TaxID=1280664 RepID=UPI0003FF3424|nr:6-hydroxymethylpterin diphosphokinase MptE-like protein [Butyrivibrio sp. VCD2006]
MTNLNDAISVPKVDENLRKKNFDAFSKRYGVIPEIVKNEEDKYRMGKAQNGEPILYIKGACEGSDLRMNSSYDPSYEAMKWSEGIVVSQRRATIALLGVSTGVYLRSLVKKLRPDTCFFVYEPNEDMFSYLCGYIDFTDLIELGRVFLFVSKDQYRFYSELLSNDITASRSEAVAIKVPYYGFCREFEDACEASRRIMRANENYLRQRGRAALLARIYAWNHLKNATFLPDLKTLVPDDTYAVIVAAGPSLLRNVEELKRIKNHAIIICTDRAASVLDKHEIVPDLVASFDTLKSEDYLRVNILDNVPLLCSYQTNIATQEMFSNRIIYMHALSYENKLIGDRAGSRKMGLDLGGNVAGGCFVACRMLGIRNIVLVGQDLAFSGEQHHADGIDEGVPNAELRTVKGIDGGDVKSLDMWLIFKEFYERQIALNTELRVIDATEGGAFIEGTTVMRLRDVADMICNKTLDLGECIKNLPRLSESELQKAAITMKEWSKELSVIAQKSVEISDLCRALVKICKYQDITDIKVKNKLVRLEALLKDIYSTDCWDMLKEYWIEDMYSVPSKYLMLRNNEESIPVLEDLITFFDHLPSDTASLNEALTKHLLINNA